MTPKVGILALQGAVGPHVEKLRRLEVEPVEVRTPEELATVQAIILPGGESSTMIHLLRLNRLWEPLGEFVKEKPTWGICAGAILLAKRVSHPAQESLEALDIEVERNAYGRQVASFIDEVEPVKGILPEGRLEGVFIRAPRIKMVGATPRVLVTHKGEPVMVEERNVIASTFHPELTSDDRLHLYFLKKLRG